MPQPFNRAQMTDSGAALLTKAQAGQCNIEFTRMAIGDGVYTEEEETPEELKKMTNLKSLRNSYNPEGIVIYSEKSVRISARITNFDSKTKEPLVTESYYINEIGLFAKEKDGAESTEVLYSIATTSGEHGDEMPAYTGDDPIEIIQEYFATVDNSMTVTIDLVDGAFALAEDVEAMYAVLESHIRKLKYDADTETLILTSDMLGDEEDEETSKDYFNRIEDKENPGEFHYVRDTEAHERIDDLIAQIVSGTVSIGLATEDGALLTTEDGRILLAERKLY